MNNRLELLELLGSEIVYDGDNWATQVKIYCSDKYEDLKKSLTPPTAEDVCDILTYETQYNVIFNETNKKFYFIEQGYKYKIELTLNHLSQYKHKGLLGRFYEGVNYE